MAKRRGSHCVELNKRTGKKHHYYRGRCLTGKAFTRAKRATARRERKR